MDTFWLIRCELAVANHKLVTSPKFVVISVVLLRSAFLKTPTAWARHWNPCLGKERKHTNLGEQPRHCRETLSSTGMEVTTEVPAGRYLS